MNDHHQLLIASAEELRNWLRAHHDQKESIWLIRWKKDSGHPYVSYDDVVDELICFGWVDSLPRKLDEQKSMLRISPRNPTSNWSGVNKRRVARLSKAGRMEPSGIALVDHAKATGAWTFLDDVEQLLIPADLDNALEKKPKAKYYFDRFPASSKRGILEWIKNAKQETTRASRILETAHKAAQNRKANHPKGRDAGPTE